MVKGVEQRERDLDRCITRVRKLRPESFIKGLYRWLVLSQRKFEPDVGVHVAVRKVVHNLPDRPAAGTIRRIELLLREAGDGVTQGFRRGRDLSDCAGALSRSERRLQFVFPDWVTQIHSDAPYVGLDPKSQIRNARTIGSRKNSHPFFNSSAAAAKNRSTIFFASPSLMRCPTDAIIPPTCASPG